MISRSCTYLRSVSTVSLIMLLRADSCALAGVEANVSGSESKEALSRSEGGEGGSSSKASGGRWSTIAVTVFMTYNEWGK